MKYTFRMSDAYGDDYNLDISAVDLSEARSKATLIDDDAVPEYLINVEEELT